MEGINPAHYHRWPPAKLIIGSGNAILEASGPPARSRFFAKPMMIMLQGAPALYSGRSEDRPFKGLRISLFGQVPNTSNAIAVSVTGLFVLGICVQRLAFIGPHFLAVCRLDQ